MGKRTASAKATRGVSKAKQHVDSSSSNPKTKKFRSQYNNLVAIAKGGPSKKVNNSKDIKKLAKDALERKKLLDQLGNIDMVGRNFGSILNDDIVGDKDNDDNSQMSQKSNFTTASFASIWSNCSNNSLAEFFNVWNPKSTTHKDALAVIAGLSQTLQNTGSEQTDLKYSELLFKIISSDQDEDLIAGSLLALTFVLRKLSKKVIFENFETHYTILKELMEKYNGSKRKTIVKCLLRCFAVLSRSHPDGKKAIDAGLRKKINIATRKYKVQSKIKL